MYSRCMAPTSQQHVGYLTPCVAWTCVLQESRTQAGAAFDTACSFVPPGRVLWLQDAKVPVMSGGAFSTRAQKRQYSLRVVQPEDVSTVAVHCISSTITPVYTD